MEDEDREKRRRAADAAFGRMIAEIRREEMKAVERNGVYIDTWVRLPERPDIWDRLDFRCLRGAA